MVKTKNKIKIKQTKPYTKPKKLLWGYKLVIILVILASLTAVFWDDIMCIIPYTSKATYRYSVGTTNRKTVVHGKDLIICGNDGVYCITSDGKEKWTMMTSFPEPLISVSDAGTAVSSKNSKEIFVIDNSGKSERITLEDPVNNIKISDSGYITAIVHKKDYNGGVVVYNPKGLAAFSWSAGKTSLIDASLSPNGKLLAVSAADFSAANAVCSVLMFDITKSSDAYATVGFGDNMIVNVNFSGTGSVLCVGDKSFVMCNSHGGEKWRFDYGGQTLNFYDVTHDSNLVFVLGNSSLDRNMNIYSYRKSGRLNGKSSMEFDISKVSASRNRVIVASQHEIAAISKFGKQKALREADKDITKIGCFERGNFVFADFGGYIETFMFK